MGHRQGKALLAGNQFLRSPVLVHVAVAAYRIHRLPRQLLHIRSILAVVPGMEPQVHAARLPDYPADGFPVPVGIPQDPKRHFIFFHWFTSLRIALAR